MGYLADFERAIENHDAPLILRLWEEYVSVNEVDAKEFIEILEVIKSSDLEDYIGRYVEKGLHLWSLIPPGPDKNEVLRLIVDLEVIHHPDLRKITIEHLEECFGHEKDFHEKMRLVGLRGGIESFKGAISHYLLLNHMKKGNFVFHTAGWGVGEIMEVSMLREQLNCEFDYVPGRKDLSFKIAFQTLIPVSETHFLARRFGDPDALEVKAKQHPVEVIRMLLKDLGPKNASEIKEELCELVIPEEEWHKWWQTARSKVKKDTLIESPKSAKFPFKLLKKDISHEERLYRAFEDKPEPDALIQMMYTFFKDFSDTLKNSEFRSSLLEKLKEMIALQETDSPQELQLYFFLQDLTGSKTYPPIDELLKKSDSIEGLIAGIPIQSFKKRALQNIRRIRDDWDKIFLSLLFVVEHNPLRDFILNALLESSLVDDLKEKLSHLSTTPQQYPELVIWYFQKIMGSDGLPMADAQGRSRFFEALLILLSYLEQQSQRRDLVKKIHSLLHVERFALVRKVMKSASIEDVREFLLLVTKCHSLKDHDIQIFHSLAEVVHPELKWARSDAGSEEEDVIWTTKKGYAFLKTRVEQIGTVETVENAREIQEARSHQDLRENAEYKAALERRDHLQATLKLLSDQLNKCRILTHQDIDTNTVSVGTCVTLKSEDEAVAVTYTFLGPWDTDLDNHILSYQSPLAKSMLGKKKKETVDLQGKIYVIEDITAAL